MTALYRQGGKRLLDMLLVSFAIAIFAPLSCITAVIVRLGLGSPVLFRQKRTGLNGTPFDILKFRTMTSATDADGKLLPDKDRQSRVGWMLRRTSLDELPQLFNIVKGDMSLVGPRPLPVEFDPFYTPEEYTRHTVRPGLTGLAQITGRNSLGWDERLRLDVNYVHGMSLFLDVKILLITVGIVFQSRGAMLDAESGPGRLDVARAKNRNAS